LALPRVALAHANLDVATPPPGPLDALPDTLVLSFTEKLDRGSSAALLDVNGTPIDGVGSQMRP
jgi:methionine-rich copper-binding protein CopC